jgi:hypothetical protein
MKHKLKDVFFKLLMVVMFCCLTVCSLPHFDYQTFDELSEIQFRVSEAYVRDTVNKPFPYGLHIIINNIKEPFAYYSDEACTVRLQEDTLVTINGEPPAGLYRTLAVQGKDFEVYLDYLPDEGDAAVFTQEWFFAKSYTYPYKRHKARIRTESIPIQIRVMETVEE